MAKSSSRPESSSQEEHGNPTGLRDQSTGLLPETVALRRDLHMWPELGNDIPRTRDAVLAALEGLPLDITSHRTTSGVAAATARSHPYRVAALLLLTPFDSLVNVAAHHYPVLPVRWLLRDRYPSAQWLDGYRGPVAIIVAGRDTIVPARFGRQLPDGYQGPKLLITAENADHNDVLYLLPESAWAQALSFLLDGTDP